MKVDQSTGLWPLRSGTQTLQKLCSIRLFDHRYEVVHVIAKKRRANGLRQKGAGVFVLDVPMVVLIVGAPVVVLMVLFLVVPLVVLMVFRWIAPMVVPVGSTQLEIDWNRSRFGFGIDFESDCIRFGIV